MPMEIAVPRVYKQLANGDKNLYLKYIRGYVKTLYPNIKIRTLYPQSLHLPDTVTCEESEEKRGS